MKILSELAIIFGFCLLGDQISMLLPIPFPGSVIAMLLLFVALATNVVKEEQIQTVGDFILKNMGFFFIPAGVSVLNYLDILKKNIVPFLFLCVITLILTFGVTAFTVSAIMKAMQKKEEKKGEKGR